MTANPKKSHPMLPESQGIPAKAAAEPDADITVDHVYLPLDGASAPPAIAASSALENVRPSKSAGRMGRHAASLSFSTLLTK
jgi:hypothetical protein